MVLDVLMGAHVMYRLVETNSAQQRTLEKIPNLYCSIQRCGDQLERVLRVQDSGGNDVGVAFIL